MVVLPLPLSPTNPTVLPSGTSNETSVTALMASIGRLKNDDRLGNQTVSFRLEYIHTECVK
jgi:hypothetical protein